MPGSMRDGVLVTPLTPRCSFTCGGGICGSSRLFDGRLVAPSQALVAPSLDTSVRPRRGIRLSSIYHPAENHKFALRKERGEAAETMRAIRQEEKLLAVTPNEAQIVPHDAPSPQYVAVTRPIIVESAPAGAY